MSAGIYNFTVEQGTQFHRVFRWTAAGEPVNLTGVTARMHWRDERGTLIFDATPYLTIDAAAGSVTLDIPESVTSGFEFDSLDYDLKLVDGMPPRRLIKGTVTLDPQETV